EPRPAGSAGAAPAGRAPGAGLGRAGLAGRDARAGPLGAAGERPQDAGRSGRSRPAGTRCPKPGSGMCRRARRRVLRLAPVAGGPHVVLTDAGLRRGDPFAAEPDPALLAVTAADVLAASAHLLSDLRRNREYRASTTH